MGKCIKFSEKLFLGKSESMESAGGVAMAILIPALFWFVAFFALASLADPILRIALAVLLLKSSFALKALIAAAKAVEESLGKNIEEARSDLRSLCSRDASELTEEELVEGAASSLAENLCDSVVAPIFYFCIGGVPLAIAYRVINTMDAMIGYKNHYIHLGWAAARLDDLMNWIPARITALLLLVTGVFTGKDAQAGYRIAMRDHAKTPSPNGGWPMAMAAGLLGLQFRKSDVYVLGDAVMTSNRKALVEAQKLTLRTGWLFFAYVFLGLGGSAF